MLRRMTHVLKLVGLNKSVVSLVLILTSLNVMSAETVSSPILTVVDTTSSGAFEIGDTVTITASFVHTPSDPGGSSAVANNALDLRVSALPSGLSYVSTACAKGSTDMSCSNNTAPYTWTNIDLNPTDAAAETYSLTITATINNTGSFQINGEVLNLTSDVVNPASLTVTDNTIVPVDLSLALTKVSPATVNVDDDVTFQYQISNGGTRNATGVAAVVTLPSGYVLKSGSSLTTSGQSITAGGSAQFSLIAVAQAATHASNEYRLAGQITAQNEPDSDSTANNGTSNGEDDAALLTSNVVQSVDLALSFTSPATAPTVNIGSTQSYTLQLSNAGPSKLSSGTIKAYIPDGYTVNTATGASQSTSGGKCLSGSASCTVLTWSVSELASSANTSLTFSLDVTAGNSSSDSYLIAAEVSAASDASYTLTVADTVNNYPVNEDDDDTLSLNLADASLALVVNGSDNAPTVGSEIPLVFTLSNASTASRSTGAVNICIDLPAGLAYSSDNAASSSTTLQANSNGCDQEWQIPLAEAVAANASLALTLNATVAKNGPYNVAAEVRTMQAPDSDSKPNDATGDDAVSFNSLTPVASADLELDMVVDNAAPNIGSSIQFTLTLSNNGPSDVGSATVVNALPSGFAYVSSSSAAGSISQSNGVVTWSGIALTSGSNAVMTINADVQADTQYRNTAEVTASNVSDPDSTVNNAVETEDDFDAVTAAPPSVTLVVAKEGGPFSPSAGDQFQYNFRVSNNSLNSSPDTQISDVVPLFNGTAVLAGFDATAVSWSCEAFGGACCNSGTTQCGTTPNATSPVSTALSNVAMDLPANSYVVISVSGNLDARSSGTISNAVSAVSSRYEEDTSDNTSINTINEGVGSEANLKLVKSAGLPVCDTPVAICTTQYNIPYTIQVINDGPSLVTGALVTDLMDGQSAGTPYFEAAEATWTCSTSGGTAASTCAASGAGVLDGESVTLEPGATATFTITALTRGATGTVSNTASVAAPVGVVDPILSDNTDSVDVVLSGTSEVWAQAFGPATEIAGTEIKWTFQAFNDGPDDALNATLSNVFPAQVNNITWTCDATTPIPGDLSLQYTESRGVAQLGQPKGILQSEDGRHVYVAGRSSDTVLAYTREVVPGRFFGALTQIDIEQEGVPSDSGLTVEGLDEPVALALSPDGRHVYAAAASSDSISWFTRDTNPQSAQYGQLTWRGFIVDASLDQVEAIVVSPDGSHVYAASSTAGEISFWSRDNSSGGVSLEDTYSHDATDLAISSDGQDLFASLSSAAPSLVHFDRENNGSSPVFGSLTLDNANLVNGSGMENLAFSQDDAWLVASSLTDDALYVYSWDADSSALILEHTESLTAGSTPGSLAFSADGQHLAVGVQGNGSTVPAQLNYYRFNQATGLLTLQTALEDNANGIDFMAGLSGLLFSADGRHLLTVSETENVVSIFDRRAPDPILSFMEIEAQGEEDDQGNIPATTVDGLTGAVDVEVTPDGRFVYAASLGGSGAIAAFERDPSKGGIAASQGLNLIYLDSYLGNDGVITGLNGVMDIAIDPVNGDFLFAASQTDNAVVVFKIENDGQLTFVQVYFDGVGGVDGLGGASGLAVDPFGRYLYVAGLYEDAVSVFDINASTGMLTQTQIVRDSDVGVNGLDGAVSLSIAPDSGAESGHLMVASSISDSVVVFDRAANGQITWEASYAGAGDRPLGIATSSDGEHVYVAASNSGSIAVYARASDETRADFGELGLIGFYQDGVDGIAGLRGARDVVVSPDGGRVYVAAETDASLLVFDRNGESSSATFGQLTYVLRHVDGENGIDGLEQIYAVAVSADGQDVYTAALADDAVAAFRQGNGSRCPASGSGNLQDVAVDIAVGGVLTLNASAVIDSSATVGSMTNSFQVSPPDGFIDPGVKSNQAQLVTALDVETDLYIEKTDQRISAIAGEALSYTITVGNHGPSDALHTLPSAVTVADTLDTQVFDLSQTSWQCEAFGSGSLTTLDVVTDGVDQVDGLFNVSSVAIAGKLNGTGGQYVYGTGLLEDALSVFQLNDVTEQLDYLTVIKNGDLLSSGTADKLVGARDVSVSADGQYVIVAAQLSDAITVFSATETLGQLALDWLADVDKSTANGLDQVVALTRMASNGDFYAAGARNHAIVQLNWDSQSETLSVVNTYTGISAMQGPADVILSRDESQVIVAAGASDAVVFFDRASQDGALSNAQAIQNGQVLNGHTLSGLSGVESLAEKEGVVYAASPDVHSIVALAYPTQGNGLQAITWLQTIQDGADGSNGIDGADYLLGVSALTASADGFHLYAASRLSHSLSIIGLSEAGNMTVKGRLLASDGVQGLEGAAALALDATGQYLLTADSLSDQIALFARKADSVCATNGAGDINTAVSIAAGGKLVFTLNTRVLSDVLSSVSNTATVAMLPDKDLSLSNNAATDVDTLSRQADISIEKFDEFRQFDGLAGISDVVLSHSGEWVFSAGHDDNAIGSWQLSSGQLAYLSKIKNTENGISGLNGVYHLAISPDDAYLYAVAQLDNALTVFEIQADGSLVQIQDLRDNGTITGLGGAQDVLLSPDGDHVYVLGKNLGAVLTFSRDDSSGLLTWQGLIRDGLDGVQGLSLPDAMSMSPDGLHLFVNSKIGNTLTVLSREAADQSLDYGDLTFVKKYQTGFDGISGMEGPSQSLVSGDGQYVYVLATGTDSILWFSRALDGSLSYQGSLQDVSSQSLDLAGASDLVLNPAGDKLFVTAGEAHTINYLDRSVVDGSLTAVAVMREGDATPLSAVNVQGLRGAAAVVLDAARSQLIIAAENNDALSLIDSSTDLDWLAFYPDEGGGAPPGGNVTYHIIVSNQGPSDADGALVSDVFPAVYQSINWTCASTDLAFNPQPSCIASGSGDLSESPVNLPAGTSVEFVAVAHLRTDARGHVVNTAEVVAPAGVLDVNAGNNSSTDDDTVLTVAVDLEADVDNGVTELVPGASATYTFTVDNLGPGNVEGVGIQMPLPEGLAFTSWQCQATPAPGLLQDAGFALPAGLDTISDAVISSDGRDYYAVGTFGGVSALARFTRDERTGELSFDSRAENGQVYNSQLISGMDGASSVAISPDGYHLYVAAASDDALLMFERAADGSLSYQSKWLDGVNGVDGLAGVNQIEISEDGTRLYALASADNSLTVFDRDWSTGLITWSQTLFAATVSEVDQLSGFVVSEDSRSVYAMAFTHNRLVHLRHDALTGVLLVQQQIDNSGLSEDALLGPVDLALINDQTELMVLSQTGESLAWFSRSAVNGDISLAGAVYQGGDITGLAAPLALLSAADGLQTYVLDASQNLILFAREDESYTEVQVLSSLNQTSLSGAAGLVAGPLERQIYAYGTAISSLNIQAGSYCGKLGYGGILDVVDISAGGQLVYTLQTSISSAYEGDMTLLGAASVPGTVVELDATNNEDTDTDPVTAQYSVGISLILDDVLIAGLPASYSVQIVNSGTSDVLGLDILSSLPLQPGEVDGFDINNLQMQCLGTEPLSYQQFVADARSGGVDYIQVSPDARTLYALDSDQGSLVSWQISAGVLTELEQIDDGDLFGLNAVSGLAGSSHMSVSADGQSLYVSGGTSDSLLVFNRDTANGNLELVQTLTNTPDQAVNLSQPGDIAISPDGRFVYVAARGVNGIVVFERNLSTGQLAWEETQLDGFDSIYPDSDVLRGINTLVMADGGRVIYVTADLSNTIAAFVRDESTGHLNYQGSVRNLATVETTSGTEVLEGLQSPAAMLGTAQGQYLYVLANATNQIFVFEKSETDSSLTLIQTLTPSTNGLPAFSGLVSAALNPDASRLYVLASDTAQLLTFRRNAQTGLLTLVGDQSDNSPNTTQLADSQIIQVIPDTGDVFIAGGDLAGLNHWDPEGYAMCPGQQTGSDALHQTVDMSVGSSIQLSLETGQLPPFRRNDVRYSVTAGKDATQAGQNSRSDAVEVHTDIQVSMTQSGGRTVAGEPLEMTLTVSNPGPSSVLEGEVDFSVTGDWLNRNWLCSGTGASCTNAAGSPDITQELVNIPPQGRLEYVVSGELDPGFINQNLDLAWVSVTETGAQEATNLNDTVQTSLNITGEADVSIDWTGDNLWIPGISEQYLISIENAGPSHSAVTSWTESLIPAQLSQVTLSCATQQGGECPVSANSLTSPFDLPAGSRVTITVDGNLIPSIAAATINLSASVNADVVLTDPDLSNNQINESVTIQPQSDLSVLMVDSTDPYDAAANHPPLEFLVSWQADGPSDAIDADIVFDLPDGYRFVDQTFCTLLSTTTGQVVCGIGTVAPGGSGNISLRFDPDPGMVSGVYTSQALISSSSVDLNTQDNLAVETTTLVNSIDLTSQVVDAPVRIVPGDSFSFRVELENLGSGVVTQADLQVDMDDSLLADVSANWVLCNNTSQQSCVVLNTLPITAQSPVGSLSTIVLEVSATLLPDVDPNTDPVLAITVTPNVVIGDADSDPGNDVDITLIEISDTLFIDGFESL